MYDILHCTGDYHILGDWSFCHLLNHSVICRLLTLYKDENLIWKSYYKEVVDICQWMKKTYHKTLLPWTFDKLSSSLLVKDSSQTESVLTLYAIWGEGGH